jgi:hypothetical protein
MQWATLIHAAYELQEVRAHCIPLLLKELLFALYCHTHESYVRVTTTIEIHILQRKSYVNKMSNTHCKISSRQSFLLTQN